MGSIIFIPMKGTWLILLSFLYFPAWAQQSNRYKVIAYSTGNDSLILTYPLDKITHLIFSFVKLQHDTLCFSDEKQRNTLQRLVEQKKLYPRLKIMISIGGWGGCSTCSELVSSAEHRKVFAETTASLLRENRLDGIDLDWEYPAIEGYPGHAFSPADKNNFTLLLKELRKAMGNDLLMSFAAGGFTQYLDQSIDWEAVMPLVDFVNLMTYDLVGGYSQHTGHHTPLSSPADSTVQESVSTCVQWLLDHHVIPEKLMVGAAMYARVWENVPDTNHGLYQPGIFRQSVDYKNFENYFSDSSHFSYFWDSQSNAPYRYNPQSKLFATFDDERSIKEKVNYIRRKKLGGIMFWNLMEDKPNDGLLDVMFHYLK